MARTEKKKRRTPIIRIYRCQGCDEELHYYRKPRRCDICGYDQFVFVRTGENRRKQKRMG